MTTVVKIDGDAIDLAEFVRLLKLTGQFEALLEQFVRDRLAVLGARKAGIQVSEAEFEAFLTDSLYQEKMLGKVCGEQAVQGYFKLNSPKFDSVEVSHIVLDSEAKAKEMIAVLRDDPDSFHEMAREHSIADTREHGGLIGKVLRGSLRSDVEGKVFNAAAGDLLGPFASGDRTAFEIFRVNAKHPARLDDDTTTEVRRLLREEWLRARAQEHVIE